jgi:hypothetical protein
VQQKTIGPEHYLIGDFRVPSCADDCVQRRVQQWLAPKKAKDTHMQMRPQCIQVGRECFRVGEPLVEVRCGMIATCAPKIAMIHNAILKSFAQNPSAVVPQ